MGLSQDALATKCGMRRTDIVRLESGALKCTKSSTRRLLAEGFGLDFALLDDFLDGRTDLNAFGLPALKGAA